MSKNLKVATVGIAVNGGVHCEHLFFKPGDSSKGQPKESANGSVVFEDDYGSVLTVQSGETVKFLKISDMSKAVEVAMLQAEIQAAAHQAATTTLTPTQAPQQGKFRPRAV